MNLLLSFFHLLFFVASSISQTLTKMNLKSMLVRTVTTFLFCLLQSHQSKAAPPTFFQLQCPLKCSEWPTSVGELSTYNSTAAPAWNSAGCTSSQYYQLRCYPLPKGVGSVTSTCVKGGVVFAPYATEDGSLEQTVHPLTNDCTGFSYRVNHATGTSMNVPVADLLSGYFFQASLSLQFICEVMS